MTAARPHPCCVPSRFRAELLAAWKSADRKRAPSGSTDGMVKLDGGRFLMGSEDADSLGSDGEGPVRQFTMDPFYIDAAPVTNAQFREFFRATGYRTDSERLGWSFVFQGHIAPER